jgi:hypothetical protein
MAALLDIETGSDANARRKRVNVAAGMPHDCDGFGIIPGREQGPRAVQQRLSRRGN